MAMLSRVYGDDTAAAESPSLTSSSSIVIYVIAAALAFFFLFDKPSQKEKDRQRGERLRNAREAEMKWQKYKNRKR